MLEMGILRSRKFRQQPGLRRVKVSTQRTKQEPCNLGCGLASPAADQLIPIPTPPDFLRSAAGDGGGPVLRAPRDCKGRGRAGFAGKAELWIPILMATGYKHRLVGGVEEDPASPMGQAEECQQLRDSPAIQWCWTQLNRAWLS